MWIDGGLVATHKGAYMPFEARPDLKAGQHLLVVRADWRDPVPGMKRESWQPAEKTVALAFKGARAARG